MSLVSCVLFLFIVCLDSVLRSVCYTHQKSHFIQCLMYYEMGDNLSIDEDASKWQIWVMPAHKRISAFPQSQSCALFVDSAFLLVNSCLRQDDSAYFEEIKLCNFISVAKHQALVVDQKFCWSGNFIQSV